MNHSSPRKFVSRRPLPKTLAVVAGLWVFSSLLPRSWSEFRTSPAPQVLSSRAQTPSDISPFQIGEKFTYLVSWKVFDAGIATLSLVERFHSQNEDLYRIRATVRSTGIVATLFKVVDFFESQVHMGDFCSRQIVKNIQEGRRQRTTMVSFDHRAGLARMNDLDLNRPEVPPKHSETQIPPCVQDVISAFYLVRSKSLKVGETLRFPINDGGRTYDLDVEAQAMESIKTPAGTFQTIRLEPKVFGGLFKNKGRLFVWISNDSERVPVMMKARIAIGTITVALTKAEKGPTMQAPTGKGHGR